MIGRKRLIGVGIVSGALLGIGALPAQAATFYSAGWHLHRRVARGIAAPGSHRTERDSLPSFRSSHPSVRNR
jgi:hypothetical protein